MILGFSLKNERKKRKMTQTELAKAVGVSLSGYRLWESGGGNPSAENLKKLKQVLKIRD